MKNADVLPFKLLINMFKRIFKKRITFHKNNLGSEKSVFHTKHFIKSQIFCVFYQDSILWNDIILYGVIICNFGNISIKTSPNLKMWPYCDV